MIGHILLAGGAEFGGRMVRADKRAIHLAGGMGAPIRVIPAAAAADNNHIHAGNNGVRWFTSLGVKDVTSLPLIDSASADQPEIAEELRNARLIYMLGGSPEHLYRSLAGSKSWEAILAAYQDGAVIAGSSAGAMVLCEHYYNPHTRMIATGLNLVQKAAVIPHYNTLKGSWLGELRSGIPGSALIGIDEGTGLINDGVDGDWTVYGGGQVTLHLGEATNVHPPGENLKLAA